MKLKTKQTTETTIEIPVPSFYRSVRTHITEHLGIIDENNVLMVNESEWRTSAANTQPVICERDILEAVQEWETITEDEFMTAYRRALNSLSLTPELVQK